MAAKHLATYPSLAGRVVVISGGATGIGAEMVEAFSIQRARVVILDVLEVEATTLMARLTETHKLDTPPKFYRCDVTDIEGGLRPVAKTIRELFPKIHALINNAAKDTRIPTMEIEPKDWDDGLAVNLRHQFFLTQALMPSLIAAGSSSVINMGSITWAIPGQGLVPYVASKSAIVGLTRTLAHEFGAQGVRVNSIMPGAIATERQKKEVITPEYAAHVLGRQAVKRILLPEEVAKVALFLVADDSAAITNQSIVVDGGWI